MITIIGSLNYDLVTYTKRVPDGGETIQANSFEKHLGGKGLNEALACARLRKSKSTDVRMVGNVGDDSFGNELKDALVEAKVDTSNVAVLEGELSGVATILVELSGENRILIIAGANGRLKPEPADFERIFPASSDNDDGKDFVVLQNEFPYTVQSILWLKRERPHLNIAYNPSPFAAELISEANMAKIDLLIVNEGEARAIANEVLDKSVLPHGQVEGLEFYSALALKLQQVICQTNVCTVIITLGSKGCVYSIKLREKVQYEPAVSVTDVLDTTGAGDTFFGGIVLQLAEGKYIEEAVKFATVASSLAIQRRGAAESIPVYEDVVKAM